MSDFYIPPAEISARLLNFAGQQVLTKGEKGSHSRYGEYTRVGQAPASTDSDEQYWSFEGTGRVRLIRNKSMNKVMLVSSPDEPVPIYLTDGSITKSASAASFVTLEPGKGKYEGYFRLIRICGDSVSIITSEPSGVKIGKIEPGKIDSYPISSEQYFTFDYEPMEVDSIEYNLKESRRFNERPHILVDTYLTNSTESEQTLTYELNEKTATTSRWDYKLGAKLGITRKIKTGIPKMAEGELAIDFSVSFEWSQGKTETTEHAWKAAFPVKAKPGERVRAKSSVWMGNVEVPYTLVLKTQSGHRVEQKGIWHGVLAWNLRHELKTETADGKEVQTVTL